MTVVNALSSFFELTSYREKENTKHVITFKDGEKVDDKLTKRGKNDPVHGSRIRFIINKNLSIINLFIWKKTKKKKNN